MNFINNFYLSDTILDDRKTIVRRLNKIKKPPTYILLSISDIKDGMIDIIPSMELKLWPKTVRENLIVIGVTKTFDEAEELISNLAVMVFEKKGNYDLKTYFKEQEFWPY